MHDAHHQLATALQEIPQLVGTPPEAILVISAHWEEPEFTAMAHPNPPMIYDYSGFPEHTYRVEYPKPGAPDLAERARRLLEDAGLTTRIDSTRGFDHGVYAPLSVMYPLASIPVIQLSLKAGLDAGEHVAAGRSLAALRESGVLIIGSGSSSHNLGLMGRPEARQSLAAFDAWLQRTLVGATSEDREAALSLWERAPGARQAHPREAHLLPLMVAAGAARHEQVGDAFEIAEQTEV